MTKLSRQIAVIFGVMLALVPLMLFTYLGLHNRVMADDYIYLGLARDVGTWKAMAIWREVWNGDYSNFLLYGLLARLGTAAPPVFALFLCASAFVGFGWLTNLILAYLGIRARRRIASVVLAALTTAATINGFYHPQVFYYLTVAVEYTWPAVMLLLGIALAVETARRLHGNVQHVLVAFAAALYALINAGFSEMYLVFQLTTMALIAVFVFVFQRGPKRNSFVILAMAGLLGTVASLPLQLTTHGVAYRTSLSNVLGNLVMPVRELPDLLGRTLNETLYYAGKQDGFTGFMLVAFAALFVMLTVGKRSPVKLKPWNKTTTYGPIAFALGVQLLFVPILLTHSSDSLQVFGRFSFAFALVVCLNLLAITVLLGLLWRRDLLDKAIKRQNGLMIYCLFVLLLVCLFFAMTQARNIHYKAASYLLFAAVTLLIMLAWQLTCMADEPLMKALFRLSAFATAGAFVTLAALLAVKLWSVGYIIDRTLTAAIFALMLGSLFIGVALGALIQRGCPMADADARWLRGIRLLCLLVVLTIVAGIVIGQGQWISHVREDTTILEEGHEEITRLRDAGNPAVFTKKFPRFNPDEFGSMPYKHEYHPLDWSQLIYYGLLDESEAIPTCHCSNEAMALGDKALMCARITCLAFGLRGGDYETGKNGPTGDSS